MKNTTFAVSTGFLILLSGLLLFPHRPRPTNGFIAENSADVKDTGLAKIVRLAEVFKATLKNDQLASLQLAYSKQDAVKWSNFPQAFSQPKRVGINLGSLNPTQLAAAKSLMATVLSQNNSNEGYGELQGILAADDYFGKTTGKADVFGSANYCMAFLGQPSTTALWELQFGGHHVVVSNTYNGGKVTGVTPSFRGVEPMAVIRTDAGSFQPLEQERTAFAVLLESLSGSQKASAKLSTTFSDVLLGPGKDGVFPAVRQGIKASSLTNLQRQQLIKAIELYVNDLDAATAREIMAGYLSGLPDTYVCFSGSGAMTAANDYIRIDGPRLWIEYSAQASRDFPGTTHPHSVWRDRISDYGGN